MYIQVHVHVHIYSTYVYTCTSVLPGYLEWWLDSTWHLVLFIQYILNTVSVAYICII